MIKAETGRLEFDGDVSRLCADIGFLFHNLCVKEIEKIKDRNLKAKLIMLKALIEEEYNIDFDKMEDRILKRMSKFYNTDLIKIFGKGDKND